METGSEALAEMGTFDRPFNANLLKIDQSPTVSLPAIKWLPSYEVPLKRESDEREKKREGGRLKR